MLQVQCALMADRVAECASSQHRPRSLSLSLSLSFSGHDGKKEGARTAQVPVCGRVHRGHSRSGSAASVLASGPRETCGERAEGVVRCGSFHEHQSHARGQRGISEEGGRIVQDALQRRQILCDHFAPLPILAQSCRLRSFSHQHLAKHVEHTTVTVCEHVRPPSSH